MAVGHAATVVYTDIASGGNWQYTESVVLGMRELGVPVRVICPWADDYYLPAELAPNFLRASAYRRLPQTLGRPLAFANAWRREPRGQRVVVAITNHLEALLLGLALRLWVPLHGSCLVVHNPIPVRWFLPHMLRRLETWLARQAWKLFDDLVVHSTEGSRVLVGYGVPAQRVHLVPLPYPAGSATTGYAWADRKGVCLVGTLRPDKDFVGVVRAYRSLPLDVRMAHPLRIRGRLGPGFDLQKLNDEIEKDSSGIENRVGFVPRREFEILLASSRACVLPYEDAASASAVATDAAALGCPVLVPDGGALAELLQYSWAVLWPEDERARTQALAARLKSSEPLVGTFRSGFAAPAEVAAACLGLRAGGES